MADAITREERERTQERVKSAAYIAKNGLGEIKWDDGTITPAGDQSYEDSLMSSYAVMFIEPLLAYEAALTASEAEVARLRGVLTKIAERTSWIGVPMDTEAASYLGQELQEIVFEAQAALTGEKP